MEISHPKFKERTRERANHALPFVQVAFTDRNMVCAFILHVVADKDADENDDLELFFLEDADTAVLRSLERPAQQIKLTSRDFQINSAVNFDKR